MMWVLLGGFILSGVLVVALRWCKEKIIFASKLQALGEVRSKGHGLSPIVTTLVFFEEICTMRALVVARAGKDGGYAVLSYTDEEGFRAVVTAQEMREYEGVLVGEVCLVRTASLSSIVPVAHLMIVDQQEPIVSFCYTKERGFYREKSQ